MSKTLVSISFYAGHAKGGDNIGYLDGALHAEWLENAVEFWNAECFAQRIVAGLWDVMVACTGFGGILNIEAGRERDAYWRIFPKTWIVGVSNNPGHQVGAALTIRLGLETAAKLGYDYLVHTAEDVIPKRGALAMMIATLDRGYDYVGERWGPQQDQLNSQFFACRAQALVPTWDACAVTGHGCIERYLMAQMAGKRIHTNFVGKLYTHTHDYEDWQRCIKGARE